jgi:hypothetical protein
LTIKSIILPIVVPNRLDVFLGFVKKLAQISTLFTKPRATSTFYESVFWMPEEEGEYTLKVLVWSKIQNP